MKRYGKTLIAASLRAIVAVSISMPLLIATNTYAVCDDIVGNSPSYIDISHAPRIVRTTVAAKGLPRKLIHAYDVKRYTIDDTNVSLIKIAYGPAHDCPAGCFYNTFVGVATPSQLITLPAETKVRLHIPTLAPFADKQCHFDKQLQVKLAKEADRYGWKIVLGHPIVCTKEEIRKTTVTKSGLLHEGAKLYVAYSGTLFVYLDQTDLHRDLSHLHRKIIRKEPIVLKKRL